MHEQAITIFGVRIWDRKYLNEYMPFSGISQCIEYRHTKIKIASAIGKGRILTLLAARYVHVRLYNF